MEAHYSSIETGPVTINPQYHLGKNMPCPDCGGSHWIVGRVVAECARCETLLPLAAMQHRYWLSGFS
ncbi:hypothetical protein [Sphingobium sp.]|uniref:hypothetical protein n=1 Tax=Sphingobium sp. TaxID=1912891 RepID=UPI003B3BC4B2